MFFLKTEKQNTTNKQKPHKTKQSYYLKKKRRNKEHYDQETSWQGLLSPFSWHCWGCIWKMAPGFGTPVQDRCEGTQEDPADINQDGQGLQQVTCGKKLQLLGLLGPTERGLMGDLIAACSCLKGSCKDDEAKLFLAVPDGVIRDDDLKLCLGSFRLDSLSGR